MAAGINLIPETQQVQQSDDRRKKLAFSLILLINGGLVGLIIVLFLVTQGQSFAISRIQGDIDQKKDAFANYTNVREMVTLQQTLNELPGLYQTRAVYTRFLSVFEKVAPKSITITTMSSVRDGQLDVAGVAPNYRLVSKLVDAMKERSNGGFENIEIKSAAGEGDTVNFSISATATPQITSVEESQ